METLNGYGECLVAISRYIIYKECQASRTDFSRSQSPTVLGHHRVDLVLAVPVAPEIQREAARLGQPLGVWPVRAEQDVLRTDEVFQAGEVVLVEGSDPHVLAQPFDRVRLERPGHLAVRLLQLLDEPGHPARAGLDTRHAHPREAVEKTLAQECSHRLERGSVRTEDRAKGRVAEGLKIARGLPVLQVAAVAGVPGVDPDGDPRLVDEAPEGIETGIGGGDEARRACAPARP